MASPPEKSKPEALDVVIVGAGISGINTAYRLQTQLPNLHFIILESRDEIGGTWSQFTYPGVRSDAIMNTLAFPWHIYPHPEPIADGSLILDYIKDAASKSGIASRIQMRHKVRTAEWSSPQQQWTITVDHEGKQKCYTARWMILGTGYYDYETPLQAEFPGLSNFKGKVIHPQFWPKDYDYENKKMAVIGSGATAVSLLPLLAEKAGELTLIQRSPSYVIVKDNRSWTYRHMPLSLASACQRLYHTVQQHYYVAYCERFPASAKERLRKDAEKRLPKWLEQDPHFKPRYNPWEQRMCTDPDGIFYEALHRPNVKVITGNITKFTDTSVETKDHKTGKIETTDLDAVVTATGLNMKMGGGIDVRVDGETLSWGNKYVWNGAMIEGVPNMMFVFGYADNTWTIAADITARLAVRLLKYMDRKGLKSAVPQISASHITTDTERIFRLSSTYATVAADRLPVYGKTGPWRPRTRPPQDYLHARWGNYRNGLRFST
ncbi:FAD/NAD(P)-binding domain-containing protein [Daldinia caldariorum]|uniref:FAD/NAD(P)-binding domain-containing protein n=1 Tax=Daldinia caldariorum TaxID=326644 RepID=UPI002007ADF5|nr:FAD/NAD(P)-binding domain-containing protein [Daldinia caldariorum]KAI1466464.1 FAD/NAD(P)-binding domain-containing protein [Daldinia caldariorum]